MLILFHDSLNSASVFSLSNRDSKQPHLILDNPGGRFAYCWNTITSGTKTYTLYRKGKKIFLKDTIYLIPLRSTCARRGFSHPSREGGFVQSRPKLPLIPIGSATWMKWQLVGAAWIAHEKQVAAAQGVRGMAFSSFSHIPPARPARFSLSTTPHSEPSAPDVNLTSTSKTRDGEGACVGQEWQVRNSQGSECGP